MSNQKSEFDGLEVQSTKYEVQAEDVGVPAEDDAAGDDVAGGRDDEDGQELFDIDLHPAFEFWMDGPNYDNQMGRVLRMVIDAPCWWMTEKIQEETIEAANPATIQTGEVRTVNGQPMHGGVGASTRAKLDSTPDGLGREHGAGWTPNDDAAQFAIAQGMTSTATERVEQAMAREEEKAQIREHLPDEQSIRAAREGRNEPRREVHISRLVEEKRDAAAERYAERVQRCRENLDEHWESKQRPAFSMNSFDDDLAEIQRWQAARDTSQPHTTFSYHHTEYRPADRPDPRWEEGANVETETVTYGDVELEVAQGAVCRPIALDELEEANRRAQRAQVPASEWDMLERLTIEVFDQHLRRSGASSEETFWAEDEANVEEASLDGVQPDGSVVPSVMKPMWKQPGFEDLITACERALIDTQDAIEAAQVAANEFWHGNHGTYPLSEIEGDWPGASVLVRVTQTWNPMDERSQQQVVAVEDVSPKGGPATEQYQDAKVTIWQRSDVDTRLYEGDIVRLSGVSLNPYGARLSISVTGDTGIDVLEQGDGAARGASPSPQDVCEAIGSSGRCGAQSDHRERRFGTFTPSEGEGAIDEPEDVTTLAAKRYRDPARAAAPRPAPGTTFDDRSGNPRDDLWRKPAPMKWVFPVTSWMSEEPEAYSEEQTLVAPTEHGEPAEEIDLEELVDTLGDLGTTDAAVTVQAMADPNEEQPALVPGIEDVELNAVGATGRTLPGTDEVVILVQSPESAPDHLQIRVHTGIPAGQTSLSAEEANSARIVAVDNEQREVVGFAGEVGHLPGYEERVLAKVAKMRGHYAESAERLEASPHTQTFDVGFDEVKHHLANNECPVDSCEFEADSWEELRAHFGGKCNNESETGPHHRVRLEMNEQGVTIETLRDQIA